jgi:hypothetical protein
MKGNGESFSNRRAIRKILPEIETCASAMQSAPSHFSGSLLAVVERRSGEGLEIAGKSLSNKASHHIHEPPMA